MFFFHRFLVASSAKRLVFGFFSQQHSFVVCYGTVGNISQISTTDTDGVYFGNFIGYGAQCRYRAKRYSFVVHIQSGNNYPDSVVGQLVAYINQPFIEKLCFVNSHYINLGCKQQDRARRVYGGRLNGIAVVRNDFFFRITGIDGWLEYFYALFGKAGTL